MISPLQLKLLVVERMLNIPGNLCLFTLHTLVREVAPQIHVAGQAPFNAALSNVLPSEMANNSNTGHNMENQHHSSLSR